MPSGYRLEPMRRWAALVLLLGLFTFALAACGGSEEATPTPENAETTGETAAETEEAGGGGGEGDAAAGKAVYEANGCGGCHVLEAAGSTGNVGPNLDDAKPDHDLVVERVTDGQGVMPAFGDKLSEEDIQNVAAFVVESTSG